MKSYDANGLMIFLEISIGFSKWIKAKLQKCLNSNKSELNFPEPVCKFEMSSLLTSSLEKK